MAFQIIQRRDYLHNWSTAEAASPPTGNLRRGEIAIAIVTSDGTDTGDIVEVIGRIGPSDTPTPFSDCPVVFRSPRGFKGADVRPVLVDEEPTVDSVLAYDSANNKFVSLDEDPGTYEEDDSGDDANELEEVSPSILALSATGLTGSATAGTRADYTLSMEVVGRPNPILSIEIIELDYPDATNSVNYTQSTAYTFTTDSLPQNVTVTTSTDSSVPSSLGATNYTISGLAVLRAAAVAKVGVAVRVSASNTVGVSPVTEFDAGSIAIVADQTGVTPEPRLTKVAISEGGAETSQIDNAATGASVTLTANYVASDFTDGVDNGAVTYQWLANGVELSGETSSSLTLTNTADAYNDSQVQVVVTIANDNGTNTRSAFIAIGDYDEGFTELSPSADSKLVYFATDGDDTAAAAAKGRGYYLPSDPEIGPDPMNPVGPIAAYATLNAARGVWGGSDTIKGPNFVDAPDWFLLRRGQTFDFSSVGDPWSNNTRPCDLPIFGASGRSDTERFVVGAWGPPADARPIMASTITNRKRNTFYQSIEFAAGSAGKAYQYDYNIYNLSYEDCVFRRGVGPFNSIPFDNLLIRRCVVVDAFNPNNHNQGMFLSSNQDWTPPFDRARVVIEECVWDRNGYKEDPNEPTTWTAPVNCPQGTIDATPGTGVQPRRTYFDRNLYISKYGDLKVRGNIISRGGGGGDLQMRSGGVCERNLFLMNSQALIMGHSQSIPYYYNDGLVVGNVFLHDEHFVPPGGSSSAITNEWPNKDLVIHNNVFTKTMRSAGYASFIDFTGKRYLSSVEPESVAKFILFSGNTVHNDGGKYAYQFNAKYSDIFDLELVDNDFWVGPKLDSFANFQGYLAASQFPDPSGNQTDEPWVVDRNRYATGVVGGDVFALAGAGGTVALAGWQAAGFDPNSTILADRAALAAAAGWTDPDRSILTYMQAVDPTYIVNEDVYVDDGSSGQKQAVRQKVWEQLVPDFSEATAKLIARNYHAFLAFIEKARNNRKGAWDSRWTADAVNNYIREGFGKPALGGAYTADLADIPVLVAEVSA